MSKSAVVLLLITAGFLGHQKFKQYRLQKKINFEKESLQSQYQELGGKNEQLTETLGYLNSDAYKELIARQQLNLQKEGEMVYSFSNSEKNRNGTEAQAESPTNFQKWARYFLNKE